MTFKEQIEKIKENWLILLIAVIGILLVAGSGSISNKMARNFESLAYGGAYDKDIAQEAYYRGAIAPAPSSDFAPEVDERKITKSASLSAEVKRGLFTEADSQVKAIIKSSNSYLLSENSNKYGRGLGQYRVGSYQIKVEQEKYDSVLAQLKTIGKITSFNGNALDITGSYTNAQINLETEEARLQRYQKLYAEATSITDKITLEDKIFDQERRVKYLKDSIEKMDQKIDYSTIYLSINEKQSGYANVVFVKLSEIIRGFVSSVNNLLMFMAYILPWAVAVFIVSWVYRLHKKKK
ncbi:MAG TPA: DUF4349 domain-containing protein [Candidatus Nanoarchaeia archaeon]|nr:DUF4349 domain-containing protein [Candidatus Nanoarchaeia archaeon]